MQWIRVREQNKKNTSLRIICGDLGVLETCPGMVHRFKNLLCTLFWVMKYSKKLKCIWIFQIKHLRLRLRSVHPCSRDGQAEMGIVCQVFAMKSLPQVLNFHEVKSQFTIQ